MADRYWVNGTGNWNDTAKWSVSSGGASGASVPTTADNVFFDDNSGTVAGVPGTFSVTITAGSACANFDASGITIAARKMTLTGTSAGALSVAGSWINPTSAYYASTFFSTPITFSATTTGKTITTNGVVFASEGNPNITFNGVGGGWQLIDAFTLSGNGATITLTNGALDLNGFTLTTGYWSSSNSNTRSIAFGTTGSISVYTTAGGSVWQMATVTGFSYTGNSSIVISGNITTSHGSTAGGTEANSLNFTYTGSTSGSVSVNTRYRNLIFSSYSGTFSGGVFIYGDFVASPTMTFGANGNITYFAGSGAQNITMNGKTFDQPIFFFGTGVGTVTLVDNFTNATSRQVSLTSGTLDLNGKVLTSGTFSTTGSSIRSILFGAGNITLTGSGTIWNGTPTNFSRTGTPTVNISNNSSTATTVTTGALTETQALDFNYTTGTYALTDTNSVYRNLNFNGFGGTVPNSTRTIYGNLTLVSGPTYTAGTNATTFAATSGTQTITTNSQTLDYPVTQNSPGATLALQDNLTLGSTRAFTLTAGTLNINGKTASVGTFASTGVSTRTIAFGTSGNITVSGSGATAWNASGSGLTTTGTTSTISMTSASAKTFVGGGYNYAATLNQGGAGTLTISGNNTFQNITNIYGATGATTITFTAGTTQTVSAFTASGTIGKLLTLNSSSAGTRFNLSDPSGSVNVSFCSIKDSNATGGARWNSYLSNGNINAGNNLGWDFSQRGGLSPVPGLSGANGLSLGVGLVGNL